MESRTYDKEFKLNAIALHKSGKSKRQVCRDLGIPGSTFLGWVKSYDRKGENVFVGSGNTSLSDSDIYAIKKELEDVRLEKEIS